MKQTLSLVFSSTAVIIATLGSTPLGEAARNAAAQVVPRNSVGPLQLKRNAVTARKLSPNAVRAGHVLDGSLLAVDFKEGQLPAGPKGDKGDRGDRGESATSLWAFVRSNGTIVDSDGVSRVTPGTPGDYQVEFTRDVSRCAVVATQASFPYQLRAHHGVVPPGNVVLVTIWAAPSTLSAQAFSIAAFC